MLKNNDLIKLNELEKISSESNNPPTEIVGTVVELLDNGHY